VAPPVGGRPDADLADRDPTMNVAWRGRTVEPVLRDALERRAPAQLRRADGAGAVVGGFWTRTNDPEIDVVVADRAAPASAILAVGSIKWWSGLRSSAGPQDPTARRQRGHPASRDQPVRLHGRRRHDLRHR